MTGFSDCSAHDRARLEAASEWRVRLRADPSLELSAEFTVWLGDFRNEQAFQAVEQGWTAITELGAAPEILDMRRGALRRLRYAGALRHRKRLFLLRGLAAALVLGLAGSAVFYAIWRDRTIFVTEVVERRVIPLPDGSRISLDADSRVRVHYSATARAIELDRGRARFDVAHDIARPFTVMAGTETVVAVGTSFNVERLGDEVMVTLIQGDVVVKGASDEKQISAIPAATPQQVALAAGQQLVAVKNSKPMIKPINLQTATAWESGQLVFKDETLFEAVARVNRYTERPIQVDRSVAMLRISGAFNAGDVGAFISAVTSYFPVQATTSSDDHILLVRRS